MTETSMSCDISGWAFDSLNPERGFGLEPGVASDEELWYRSHFGINNFDLPQWQLVEANLQAGYEFASPAPGKTPYQHLSPVPIGVFPSRSDKEILPPRTTFENLQADNSAPSSLDDLLRTASQLATERALYMNIPPTNTNPQLPHSPAAYYHSSGSPAAEPGIGPPSASASPSHHSNASDTDERDIPAFEFPQVYQLPAEGNHQPMHENNLTPLEMPDGSTRFTANWLPVDPQGGFTIRPPAHHFSMPMDLDRPDLAMHYHDHDHGHNSYNYRDAFISLDNPDAGT